MIRLKPAVMLLFCFLFGLSSAGCIFMQMGTPKKNPEQELYQEIMTAFEHRAYESCITAADQFLSKFPKSEARDEVFMRMGESFEGLLKQGYDKLIDEGMEEEKARGEFFAKYGHYNCWIVRDGTIVYDKGIFRRLLNEHPESHYADEAYYDLIPWERNLEKNPFHIQREIAAL